MKPIKLERSSLYGGNYFRARTSDMIEALTELLKYYSEDMVVPHSEFTLKELLFIANEKKLLYSSANFVLAIDDFNFLNELYKNRKSMRETNKT